MSAPPRRLSPPAAPETSSVPAVSPRIARRERRRERTRDEILDAARRVLLREGIAATTLDAVAREVGVTKTALYYYFASKDALLFELVFGTLETHAHAVRDAVDAAGDGAGALRAILQETVRAYAPRMDDFRLAFLHAQVGPAGAVHLGDAQFTRIRPLNDLVLAGAAARLASERSAPQAGVAGSRKTRAPRPSGKAPARRVEPRLLAFLAYLSAIGLLTMKGMVESVGDPLLFSDKQLVDGFAQVFAAAAEREP